MEIRKEKSPFSCFVTNYKFLSMRKEQEFCVSKINENTVSFQSDTRYAIIDLTSGKVSLSKNHSSYPNQWKLLNDIRNNEAKIYILPENDLNDIKNSEMMKNAAENIISIFSDNS